MAAIPSPIVQEPYVDDPIVQETLKLVTCHSFPAPEVPGSLLRQKEIVERLEQELEETEIAQNGDKTLVLDALRYAAALRDHGFHQ